MTCIPIATPRVMSREFYRPVFSPVGARGALNRALPSGEGGRGTEGAAVREGRTGLGHTSFHLALPPSLSLSLSPSLSLSLPLSLSLSLSLSLPLLLSPSLLSLSLPLSLRAGRREVKRTADGPAGCSVGAQRRPGAQQATRGGARTPQRGTQTADGRRNWKKQTADGTGTDRRQTAGGRQAADGRRQTGGRQVTSEARVAS